MVERRRKLVVAVTFPIYPPFGGGQVRIYQLYRKLARYFDIDIVSFTAVDDAPFDGFIAEGLREIRVPVTPEHHYREAEIAGWVGHGVTDVVVPSVTDVVMPRLSGCTPEYGERLSASIATADAVIACHPYLFDEVRKYLDGRPCFYEAQDVEWLLKKSVLPDNQASAELLDETWRIEKECTEASAFIYTCSDADRHALSDVYAVSLDKIHVVPNGADTVETPFTDIEQRVRNQERAGVSGRRTAVFVASAHPPNLLAAEHIVSMAGSTPDVTYLLVGSQYLGFFGRELPPNVHLLGMISEAEKQDLLATADVALNPVTSGSGTNVKMFDYMASGIPAISTRFGARGIADTSTITLAELDEMATTVTDLNLREHSDRVVSARRYVESDFDWGRIAEELRAIIDPFLT